MVEEKFSFSASRDRAGLSARATREERLRQGLARVGCRVPLGRNSWRGAGGRGRALGRVNFVPCGLESSYGGRSGHELGLVGSGGAGAEEFDPGVNGASIAREGSRRVSRSQVRACGVGPGLLPWEHRLRLTLSRGRWRSPACAMPGPRSVLELDASGDQQGAKTL